MNTYREKMYAITNRSSESRNLTSILVSAYSHNLEKAYEILSSLTEQDRLNLLKYVEKNPNYKKETIRKMVDIYCFFHVTLKNNPEYYLTYKTNNFMLLEKMEDRLLLAKFVTSLLKMEDRLLLAKFAPSLLKKEDRLLLAEFATSLPVANINLGR